MPETKPLYGSFSEWIKQRQEFAKKNIDSMKVDGSRDWYEPIGYTEGGDSDGGKEVSVLDFEHTEERFNRDDIQDVYMEIMQDKENTGQTTSGQVASMRMQSAPIAACERAFRHRHMTPCRGMVLGMIPGLRVANENLGNAMIATAKYFYEQGKPIKNN